MFIVLIYHPALTPLAFSDTVMSRFWTCVGHEAFHDIVNPEIFELSFCTVVIFIAKAKFSTLKSVYYTALLHATNRHNNPMTCNPHSLSAMPMTAMQLTWCHTAEGTP